MPKLKVEFTPEEQITIGAFADLMQETCDTVESNCLLCPFSRFCGSLATPDLVAESAEGYDSDKPIILVDEEEDTEEEGE
jgi:hypothetical protein